MASDAEPYIAAVADALHAAGLLVQGYDASGTRVRGGSVDLLLKADPAPAEELDVLRVLGWDEEAGWFWNVPDGSPDVFTGVRFFGGRVLPGPAEVAVIAARLVSGDVAGTSPLMSRFRHAGADDDFGLQLAAYAHSCDVTALLGGVTYTCRQHDDDGTHHFAKHWPACGAPWCLKEPGHRELHNIPWGTPVLKDGQGNVLKVREEGTGG